MNERVSTEVASQRLAENTKDYGRECHCFQCLCLADLLDARAERDAARESARHIYERAKKLERERDEARKALRDIAVAPCLFMLLGEEVTDEEGNPVPCTCPGCRARAALAMDAARAAGVSEK